MIVPKGKGCKNQPSHHKKLSIAKEVLFMKTKGWIFFEALLSSMLLFLFLYRPLEIIGYKIQEYFKFKNSVYPYLIYCFLLALINFIILTVVFPIFRKDKVEKRVWILCSLASSILAPIIYFGIGLLMGLWLLYKMSR